MCGRVGLWLRPATRLLDKGSRAYDGGTCLALTLRISFFFVHKPKCPAGNNENQYTGERQIALNTFLEDFNDNTIGTCSPPEPTDITLQPYVV